MQNKINILVAAYWLIKYYKKEGLQQLKRFGISLNDFSDNTLLKIEQLIKSEKNKVNIYSLNLKISDHDKDYDFEDTIADLEGVLERPIGTDISLKMYCTYVIKAKQKIESIKKIRDGRNT